MFLPTFDEHFKYNEVMQKIPFDIDVDDVLETQMNVSAYLLSCGRTLARMYVFARGSCVSMGRPTDWVRLRLEDVARGIERSPKTIRRLLKSAKAKKFFQYAVIEDSILYLRFWGWMNAVSELGGEGTGPTTVLSVREALKKDKGKEIVLSHAQKVSEFATRQSQKRKGFAALKRSKTRKSRRVEDFITVAPTELIFRTADRFSTTPNQKDHAEIPFRDESIEVPEAFQFLRELGMTDAEILAGTRTREVQSVETLPKGFIHFGPKAVFVEPGIAAGVTVDSFAKRAGTSRSSAKRFLKTKRSLAVFEKRPGLQALKEATGDIPCSLRHRLYEFNGTLFLRRANIWAVDDFTFTGKEARRRRLESLRKKGLVDGTVKPGHLIGTGREWIATDCDAIPFLLKLEKDLDWERLSEFEDNWDCIQHAKQLAEHMECRPRKVATEAQLSEALENFSKSLFDAQRAEQSAAFERDFERLKSEAIERCEKEEARRKAIRQNQELSRRRRNGIAPPLLVVKPSTECLKR